RANPFFTAAPKDQVVVPPHTTVSFSNPGSVPASLLVVTVFTIQTTAATSASWTEGFPPSDLFAGVPRQVLSGGATYTLPQGPIHVVVDLVTMQPGVFIPTHLHSGPEQLPIVPAQFLVSDAP